MSYSKKELEKLEKSRRLTRKLMDIIEKDKKGVNRPLTIRDFIKTLYALDIIDYCDEDLLEKLYYPKKKKEAK